MTSEDEKCSHPKNGKWGQNEPWTGVVSELKEKKGIVEKISQGHMDTGPRMGRDKDTVGKKQSVLQRFLPTHRNGVSTPR